MNRLARTLPRLAAGACLSLPAAAMVFEPAGSGHYLRSLATPDGVTRWSRAEDQPFTVTPQQPGLYFTCPPHRMMGMIGPVQAGEAVNKQAASDRVQAQKGRMDSNSQRIAALLAKVR